MSLHHKIFSSLESLKSIDSLLIFFLSLVIIYVTQFYYKYYTRINPLPGPFPLPLIGNSIEFHRNNGNLQTFLVELNHRYGAAFEVYIGGSRRIIFCDVEHVDKLFTHDVISVVTTGERAYSMACYLNTLCDKNLDYPSTILGDSERFIEGVRTHFLGAPFFIAVPNVIRHYFPMAKTRSKKIIDNRTANLFCVIAYFLAKNPLVKKKMVEEIDSIFDGDKTREITHEDLSKLRYCDAVIKEVDRLVPISNTISRYSTRKEEVGGYEWPAGPPLLAEVENPHYGIPQN
ncbi:18527_t:CDS:2 [Entrophospora sp. SA101]|nr:18527_t:CDS:2 [Entrophospora sp. SA101]